MIEAHRNRKQEWQWAPVASNTRLTRGEGPNFKQNISFTKIKLAPHIRQNKDLEPERPGSNPGSIICQLCVPG